MVGGLNVQSSIIGVRTPLDGEWFECPTINRLCLISIGRYWEMVQRLKITHFYTIPCVLQKLKSKGDEHVKKFDLSSLKVIAVGMLRYTEYNLTV